MKKMLLMAAVLAFAACGKKAETPAADTTSQVPAQEPAPMTTDTQMSHDTAMAHPDSGMAHPDSTMRRDSMAR